MPAGPVHLFKTHSSMLLSIFTDFTTIITSLTGKVTYDHSGEAGRTGPGAACVLGKRQIFLFLLDSWSLVTGARVITSWAYCRGHSGIREGDRGLVDGSLLSVDQRACNSIP